MLVRALTCSFSYLPTPSFEPYTLVIAQTAAVSSQARKAFDTSSRHTAIHPGQDHLAATLKQIGASLPGSHPT